MRQNRTNKRTWVRSFRAVIVFVTIFSLIAATLIAPSKASAAPVDTYRWNTANSINMSAARGETGSGTLIPYTLDPNSIYHGSFKSTNKSWLGLSEETCTTDIWIKLDGANSATRIANIVPSQSPYPACRDMPAIGEKIRIQGQRPDTPEDGATKGINVFVYGNPKGKKISVIIKQNGKVVKTIETVANADGVHVGGDQIEPGKYTAECNGGLPFECGMVSFEKVKNVGPIRIELGESEQAQQLSFRLFVDCSVVKTDPTEMSIFDSKNKKVATIPVKQGVPAGEEIPNNILYTGCLHSFTAGPIKLKPGEYTACISGREWCAPFAKVFAKGDRIDLLFGFEAIPDDDPVCVAGMMGWFLCPVAEITRNFSRTAAKIIEGLLYVEPLTLNTTSSNPIYTIWTIVRDIANIVFIILFLIIIFSQATSIGMSNYGIKRMLPRLLIMAILVNVSYFICAFAIDIFNLLGAGVKGLIEVGIKAAPSPNLGKEEWDGSYAGFYKAIFAAVIVLFATGQVWTLAAFVFSTVAFAVLIGFVMLVVRQVLIVLLVLLSPLAFAAALLPNTEQWYQRWKKIFVAMLASYPVLMFVYYGSALVAAIVGATMMPK